MPIARRLLVVMPVTARTPWRFPSNFCLLTSVLFLIAGLSQAQITGTLTGVVEDPTGARVAGASVAAVRAHCSLLCAGPIRGARSRQ